MNAHNLQLQIQAMAVMVRVDGMKAENQVREQLGHSLAYQEDSFEIMACELDGIMQSVSHETN